MEINRELIIKVAKNARLSLSEEEITQFTDDFKNILSAFSELDELNTSKVKPSFHPIELKNVLREDNAKESVPVEEILKNSKHKKNDYFLGPKALWKHYQWNSQYQN